MNVTLVRGIGKCIECGNMTSTQLWLGKMQFYFCDKCIQEMYYKSHEFLYKNNEFEERESQDEVPVPELPKIKIVHEGFNPFEYIGKKKEE